MLYSGLDKYMLPCLNKKLFGVDCPGCGMQRATVLLFEGKFQAAFHMYPAVYTLLPLFLFLGINIFVKFKYDFQLRIAFIILNAVIITVSYIYKMTHLT